MIKIELLDYIYDDDGQNQVNFNNVTTSSSTVSVITSERIDIPAAAGLRYIQPVTGEFATNAVYDISITISSITGSGSGNDEIGFSSAGTGGVANGIGSTVRRSTNGTTTHSFTGINGGANSNARIFADDGIGGTVTATLQMHNAVNVKKSIIGTLQVGNSEDFPLALNFSISEARDLQSRTGTFSKTFEIPATKNNNIILKSSYHEGSTIDGNDINTRKDCRIMIDDIYSVSGKLQITAVGKTRSPDYYSCVFYGDNIDWASEFDNKLLMDLSVLGGAAGSGWDVLNYVKDGTALEVTEPSISETFKVDDAINQTNTAGVTSPNTVAVVYPITGYGEYNSGEPTNHMQLYKTAYQIIGGSSSKTGYYGFDSNGDDYGNAVPCVDWRPAIFIYDIIKGLFQQEGYTISSTFIETDYFKKLVMLLPNFVYNNPQERVDANSFRGVYEGSASGDSFIQYCKFITPASSSNQSRWERIPNPNPATNYNNPNNTAGLQFNGPADNRNFVQSLNTSMYDNSTGEFTISEYGFHDIEIKNFSMWLTSICQGSATSNITWYSRIELHLQTVGETSWNVLDEQYAFDSKKNWYSSCPNPKPADNYFSWNYPTITIENRYFNKGDKLRIRFTNRCGQNSAASATTGWLFELYGGSSVINGPATTEGGFTAGSPTTSTAASVEINHKGDRVEYGQTYDVKNVIDNESTQLEFLKGVIHAFNLQFISDVESKIVYIEPFNDFFYDKNSALDWSAKLDRVENQEDKWVESTLKREMVFKYQTDSADKKVAYRGNLYWDGVLDEYPYREYLTNDFELGKITFENPFFAGSYNSGDQRTSGLIQSSGWSGTPFRALLWGECDGGTIPYPWEICRPPKGYSFLPRLLNFVKEDCQPNLAYAKYSTGISNWGIANGTSNNNWIVGGQVTSISTYEYEQMIRVCSYDNTGVLMQPLTYNSLPQDVYDCTNNTTTGPNNYRGLYQTYYQGMIEMIKANPRIKVANINLKMDDIENLDLRKLVYLDGYYYRINRIIDYKPNSNETTKIELILWDLQKLYPVDTSWNRQ